ncbi:MAG TPA: hypothetical protein VIK14_06810, partial [Ignavibacteria bacterium]
MNLFVRYYNLKGWHLFIGIILANLILIWLSKAFLINEVVFYNAYSDQLTYDRSLKLFENLKKLSWISYAFTPIVLIIKFSLVSIVLYIGIVFYNFQRKVTLGSIFKIVIASEIIFVLAGFIKFLWFYLFAGNYDLNDLGFFYPLSLINFFKKGEVIRFWIYPLQTVNLFHLFYIISISYSLNKICYIDKPDSDKIVLLSYVPSL